MILSYYLSKKILQKDKQTLSHTIANIAIGGVALGIIILILSFAITTGFRQEIENKVIGFNSHIIVSHYDNNISYQQIPIENNQKIKQKIASLPNIKNVQVYSSIVGIIRGNEDIEGLVFKGIGTDYDTSFFAKNLTKGRLLHCNDSTPSTEIVISEKLSKKLQLDTGDKVEAFFIQNPVRQRKFTIVGIYNTGLASYDNTFLLCDRLQVQKLQNWDLDKVEGWEIILNDFSKIDNNTHVINQLLDYNAHAESIIEKTPAIFSWIDLVEQNVIALIILIITIISISIISTQLTFILENITTIGILKTMGCSTKTISRIFLFISTKILVKGILIGNFVGLFMCFLQNYFHIVKLNPEFYYMSYVPIQVEFIHVVSINVGVLIISLLALVLPAYWISKKINTVKAVSME